MSNSNPPQVKTLPEILEEAPDVRYCYRGHAKTKSNLYLHTPTNKHYCRECLRINEANYRARAGDKRRESGRKSGKKFYEANPLKRIAWNEFRKAIDRGEIVRPSVCDDCGKRTKVEGHHPDYAQPLVVSWFCKRCHENAHHYKEIAA